MVAENCLRLRQRGGGFVLQRGLGDVHQLGKRGGVLRGDVGEHFAVERAFGGFEAFHKPAVGQTGGASTGIDADLPKVTERAFLDAAVAIGVLTTVIHGVGGVAVKFGAPQAKAFRGGDHPFAAFAGSWGVGNSHGSLKSLNG